MLHEPDLEIAIPPRMSDAEFFRFCRDNDELRIERDHICLGRRCYRILRLIWGG